MRWFTTMLMAALAAAPALGQQRLPDLIKNAETYRDVQRQSDDWRWQRLDETVRRSGFRGELLVDSKGATVLHRGYGAPPAPGAPSGAKLRDAMWRWASVSKQVVAVIVMQEVAAGRIDLEAPLTRYLPGFRGSSGDAVTVRQLLRHESGLPDPNDDATAFTPAFRGSYDPLTGLCAGAPRDKPGATFHYNNCDYMVAGKLLETVTGKSLEMLVRERIARRLGLPGLRFARAGEVGQKGYINGKPKEAINLPAFGGAGALLGRAQELIRFDRAMLDGTLLPPAARDQMWDGQPRLGFAALGQWAFAAPLRGCAAPMRIIERRGQIGGVQVRNFILPGSDLSLVAFSDSGGTDFGEVWQGKGLSYELLSASACGGKP